MSVDSPKLFGQKIAARCRRIGWDVETGSGRQPWLFRINMPDGRRVQIHGTPSDENWQDVVMRALDSGGFADAEAAWLADEDRRRKERIEADRIKNEKAIKLAAERSAAILKAAGPLAPQLADYAWITTPTRTPEIRRVIMTAEIAQKLLDSVNTANRKIRPGKVEFLAGQIDSGDYALTHQGGATDWNGVVQDGQHRLLAVARTGKPIEMYWAVGMDPANYGKIDINTLRTGADMARSQGVIRYENATAAAAKMIYLYDKHGSEVRARSRGGAGRVPNTITQDQIVTLGEDLAVAIYRSAKVYKNIRGISHAGVAAALYLIQRRLPQDDPRLLAFIHHGATLVGVHEGHPVYALWRMFNGGPRRDQYQSMGLVLKAWRHYVRGETVAHLRFSQDDKMPAPFLPPPVADAA